MTEEKKRILTDWLNNKIQIVVATIAFGLGIDKPDVRLVIHRDSPVSLEGYYQEIGRAGRDGKLSDCYLLYSSSDIMKWNYISPEKIFLVERVQNYAENKWDCKMKLLVEYLGQPTNNHKCTRCDNCKRPGEKETDVSNIVLFLQKELKNTQSLCRMNHLVKLLQSVTENWFDKDLERVIILAWSCGYLKINEKCSYEFIKKMNKSDSLIFRHWSKKKFNTQIYTKNKIVLNYSVSGSVYENSQIIEFELV
jgi:superfamily II DNA helicase RecQ